MPSCTLHQLLPCQTKKQVEENLRNWLGISRDAGEDNRRKGAVLQNEQCFHCLLLTQTHCFRLQMYMGLRRLTLPMNEVCYFAGPVKPSIGVIVIISRPSYLPVNRR